MLALDILQRLAATTSRRTKEQIIREAFLDGSPQFFTGARLALDPLVTFNVTKVAEILDDDGDPGDYTFEEFLSLAGRLRNRALTDHAVRDAIHAAANRCHVPTWNGFYRRILLKDLNVGVETLNKVLNGLLPSHPEASSYLILSFKCQLAHDGEAPAHQKKLRGRKLLDVKLAGVRILAVMDRDNAAVTLFSRKGSVIDHFPEIHDALRGVLPRLPGSLVLDGVLISPHGFKYLSEMADIRYALFDIIPLHDFRQGYCGIPQQERHKILEVMHECGLWAETAGRLYVIPQVAVDLDTDEGQEAFVEFNRQALANGFEGIMVKDPGAPYEGKRSAAWLKRKTLVDASTPTRAR